MQVSEMIKNLQKFMKEYGDLECWYAIDDEGNNFKKVYYDPSLRYTVAWLDDVYTAEGLKDIEEDPNDCTAICLVN